VAGDGAGTQAKAYSSVRSGKNIARGKMDLSKDQQDAIVAWATRTPLVSAVYLFGSRAKGMSRPDSDVDLALVVNGASPVNVFLTEGEDWQNDLRSLTGLLVNLDVLAGDETPKATQYVGDFSVLLFRRL
jgi:predicted nucleotidyltransferase